MGYIKEGKIDWVFLFLFELRNYKVFWYSFFFFLFEKMRMELILFYVMLRIIFKVI